jgi:hypothetical protein
MEKRIGYRSMGKLATAAAVGLAGFAASQASASLLIDIRATQVNGVPVADPKNVVAAPGQTVTFAVFAQVSGTNAATDEGFQGVTGVFNSSNGGLLGDLISHTAGDAATGFSALGSQQGSQVDVDSDGDLDIGIGPNTPTTNSNTVFQARSGSMNTNGTVLPSGAKEWEIGSLTFTIKPGATGESLVNFALRKNPTGSNNLQYGTWSEDSSTNPPGNKTPTDGVVTSSGALVSVPEPTGLALAGIAGLGLLARRRKNA